VSLLLTAEVALKARVCCFHAGREALEAALSADGTNFEAMAGGVNDLKGILLRSAKLKT